MHKHIQTRARCSASAQRSAGGDFAERLLRWARHEPDAQKSGHSRRGSGDGPRVHLTPPPFGQPETRRGFGRAPPHGRLLCLFPLLCSFQAPSTQGRGPAFFVCVCGRVRPPIKLFKKRTLVKKRFRTKSFLSPLKHHRLVILEEAAISQVQAALRPQRVY